MYIYIYVYTYIYPTYICISVCMYECTFMFNECSLTELTRSVMVEKK